MELTKDIDNLTQSQIDKILKQDEAWINLIDFLQNQIKRLTEEDDLKILVYNEIINRIQDEEVPISTKQLIELLKLLKETDNNAASGILSVLKENVKVVVNSNGDKDIPAPIKKYGKEELNANEMEFLKKLKNKLDDMEEESLSQDEIEIKAKIE
jgi:hypothetical protein